MLLAGLIAATQWVAYRLNYHPALGGIAHRRARDLSAVGDLHLGPRLRRRTSRNTLNEGYAFIGGTFILATLMLVGARRFRRHIPVREIGKDRWASKRDMKRRRPADRPRDRPGTCLRSLSHL